MLNAINCLRILSPYYINKISYSRVNMDFNVVRENDWYKSRSIKFTRSTILKILFVGKEIVVNNDNVRRKVWDACYERSSHVFVLKESWTEIKEMLRCMQKRYQKEKKHDCFNHFYDLSRTLWRMTLEGSI